MLSSWTLLVFVHYFSFLSLTGCSMASHMMDDTDGSICYSARVWKPEGVNSTYINRGKCFDDTYTAAQNVSTSDGVFLEIPFIGTSISLFIVTLPTCLVNTSIMMDGETPTIHSFHPAITTYNVQLYSSALLPFGNHSIHVDLLDFINDVDSTSCLVFDYAVINDNPDGASSLTSSTTSSPTCTPIDRQPSNRGLTGGRLGGIIGGVLAIFVLVFCTSSHWIYSTLQKRREKDGAKLTHHVSSGGSQSSTLVQISPPVSPPGPPLPAAASHSSTIPPLPVPSLSSHLPHLTTMPNQAPQPDAGIRIDARSTGSNVTFIIPRH